MKTFDFTEAKSSAERMNFNKKNFDRPLFDQKIFDMANVLMPNYNGGFWRYLYINGTPFFVLDGEDIQVMRNPHSNETMNIDAHLAGMICTIYTLNLLLEQVEDEKLYDVFDKLKNIAWEYAESINQGHECYMMLD